MSAATMRANNSSGKAALEAELKRLEEQLARQQLEEEIQKLQEQLDNAAAAAKSKKAKSPAQSRRPRVPPSEELPPAPQEVQDEVEEGTEEIEEWEEEVEEIIEEEVVEDSPPTRPKIVRKPRDRPLANDSLATPRSPGGVASPPVSPSRRFVPKVKPMDNAFTQNLAQKEAEAQQAANDKAARALAGQPKGCRVNYLEDAVDEGPLPDLPPFSPRTLPKVPESPAGHETPMELLLGPKLYKQGKLIPISTVAGCSGIDLVLLYFGAAWRRECKDFDRRLYDFYVVAASQKHNLECIYISSDRHLAEFKTYFAKVPYLAMPTQTATLKNELARQLKLVDWPALVVLDPLTGRVVTANGADDIEVLKRRDPDQCRALVQKWKSTPTIAMDEVVGDTRLKHGTMDRGYLYWQE